MTTTAAVHTPTTRLQLARRLIGITSRVLPPLLISLVCRLAALLLGIALFALGGRAIASLAPGQEPMGIGGVTLALVLMSLAKGVFRYLEQFSGHFVAFHSLAMLRNFFYSSLLPQAPGRTDGADSGDLLNRVTKDIDRIEVFFAHTLVPVATAVLAPVLTLLWLGASTSWWLALALLPFLLLAGLIVPEAGGRATDRAAATLREARGELAHYVTDSVQGVREILAFGHEERRLAEMESIEARISGAQRVMSRWVAWRRAANQALLALAVLAVSALALHLVGAGALSVTDAGMAIGVAFASFAPVIAVEDLTADLDQAFASARRVFAVTDRVPLVTDADGARRDVPTGDIVLEDVSFTHPVVGEPEGHARPRVLDGVSLRIPAGRVTAIVGPSGSGKSTLASLLVRTWDPDEGRISIGGVDLRDLAVDSLRDAITLAPQRAHVFNDSVRENLALAVPEAGEERMREVLDLVGLTEWIEAEPEGLGTRVGEMGERISGGQRQRLALARALLRGSPVTVLDEATSQVDAATERVVLEGVRRATAGGTLVHVAHRLDTVRDADLIVVMDRGRVVETGTWDELCGAGGAFSRLLARE